MNVSVDVSGVDLQTERLRLRPFRRSDLEDFYEYAREPRVGPMAGWRPHGDISETRNILDAFIDDGNVLALEYEGRVVGSVGVKESSEADTPAFAGLRCCELGFALSERCWGRGLMPEAVTAVLGWLFGEQGMGAVFCGHYLTNRQSARVQEKCGFRPLREYVSRTAEGTEIKSALNVLCREDWEKTVRGGNT